ncbi:PREDICTED: trafficking kinesin-binding protein 1 [Papilio polytes]|uniref:trafficking kinesin-binding protein 1 n=1 Tax=Papilio polytes TaxID=76194 RepID=UPI00067691A0|nr:PREDICTED: trafficking kinesin-binding protein 1 [Papilio polytes]
MENGELKTTLLTYTDLGQFVKLAAFQDAARAPPLVPRAVRHVATITEVCNSEEVPEVEIVSLLQEHIPKYRLRADSLTQFGGYENQDWFIPSPALPLSSEDLALTPDQIRETLNYFLLCSNRVSQMTKTYNDIEAVTRLLEEKEKDLELTARIGKELLAANGRLESRVTALEGELRGARDLVTQLRHDLNAKTELLQVLTNDTEDSTPTEEQEPPTAVALRKRTSALERENRALRDEAARLAAGADSAELAERQLLRDIANQLSSANSEANVLSSELSEERQRSAELQQQLDSANSRLLLTERNLQQLSAEHEHTLRILEITRENQNALAAELADAKERYLEVAAHLAEAQEQL